MAFSPAWARARAGRGGGCSCLSAASHRRCIVCAVMAGKKSQRDAGFTLADPGPLASTEIKNLRLAGYGASSPAHCYNQTPGHAPAAGRDFELAGWGLSSPSASLYARPHSLRKPQDRLRTAPYSDQTPPPPSDARRAAQKCPRGCWAQAERGRVSIPQRSGIQAEGCFPCSGGMQAEFTSRKIIFAGTVCS